MRRLTLLAAAGAVVAAIAACASAGSPPGGPERKVPPVILSISPESGQTNAAIREVEFKFDEVVSDRPSGQTAELDGLFLISPQDGSPSVGWHRNRITVRPRKGFRANTAYRVTMLPGLADLRGNILKKSTTIVFSTGSSFPPYGFVGRVFDWEAQRPASGAYVEAISRQDTTLVYVSATDSVGQFDLSPMPAGTYLVRALIDQNANRTIDPREKWDSTTATIEDSRPSVELDVIERDSTPPAVATVTVEDSVTLRVNFDKAISPRITLTPALFNLKRADSSTVQITGVQLLSAYTRAKAIADSTRAADSARAHPDTSRRAQPPAAPPPTARPTPPGVRPPPPPPKPRAPAPENAVVLNIAPATPLTPGRYSLSVKGVPNLVGHVNDTRRGFSIAPPAPRDTTRKARPDTARPPASRRPPLHR